MFLLNKELIVSIFITKLAKYKKMMFKILNYKLEIENSCNWHKQFK